jgi:hypothetical protein
VHLGAKIRCSPFPDIIEDLQGFKNTLSYRCSAVVLSIKKEIAVFSMLYLIIGAMLEKYPDNYAFEVSSRLLLFFGLKKYITHLIRQFDDEGIRYCALVAPFFQIQPPGSGLVYSMNIHTSPVVDLDFSDDQTIAISLSDRIVVINMNTASTVLDVNLPTLNEPYLNASTLPNLVNFDQNTADSTSSSDNVDGIKKYQFLVHARHHVYLVAAQENVKFSRSSDVGYMTVAVIDKKYGFIILAEINSNYIECWNLRKNQLCSRIEFSTTKIKQVLYASDQSMIVTVLEDNSIHFHLIKNMPNPSFILQATIQGGAHLDLVVVNEFLLICTFDTIIPIDFALIDLRQISGNVENLSDSKILKTLVAFDPPISPKPIKAIVLADKEGANSEKVLANLPLFTAKTNECIFIVHNCNDNNLSYIKIDGRFDIISMNAKNPNVVYTSRGGIIQMHKWACLESTTEAKQYHSYEHFLSIDISSSPVTTIKPSADDGNQLIFLTIFVVS